MHPASGIGDAPAIDDCPDQVPDQENRHRDEDEKDSEVVQLRHVPARSPLWESIPQSPLPLGEGQGEAPRLATGPTIRTIRSSGPTSAVHAEARAQLLRPTYDLRKRETDEDRYRSP